MSSLLDADTASSSDANASHSRIAYRLHADWPIFVLPEGIAAQWVLDPVLAPIPNVKKWMRGVLNLRGNLVPVFDIGQWRGYEALQSSAQVLVIAPGTEAMGVVCCETPRLLSVNGSHVLNTDDPMHEFSERCFDSEAGKAYEFNPQLWLRSVGRDVPGKSNNM